MRGEIAVVGGDGRHVRVVPPGWRVFPSSKHAGNGSIDHLVDAIRGGGVRLVIVLTRWIGHSELARVMRAARSANVDVRLHRAGRLDGAAAGHARAR